MLPAKEQPLTACGQRVVRHSMVPPATHGSPWKKESHAAGAATAVWIGVVLVAVERGLLSFGIQSRKVLVNHVYVLAMPGRAKQQKYFCLGKVMMVMWHMKC